MNSALFRLLVAGTSFCASSGSSVMFAAELTTRATEPRSYHFSVDKLPPPNEGESVTKRPKTLKIPSPAILNAPPGFVVTVYADKVKDARWLALTPSGDVLVTQTKGDDIILLRDADGDGFAEERRAFGGKRNGLNLPFGMAFTDDAFFVANTDGVMRFPYRRGQEAIEGKGTLVHVLPGKGYNQHWTRNLILSPDRRRFFVSVGSNTNVDIEPSPRASVLTMKLDGSDSRVFASGLRNPVGLALHPRTGELYAAVNERDRLGNDLVPDYITRVQKNGFYGWPYAYLSPRLLDPRHLKDGRSVAPDQAARTLTPDVLIEAHSAALGLTFYTGTLFPERYRQGAFSALRGSWNREQGTGYKIIFVPFGEDNRPEGGYEDFVTGFLSDPQTPGVWGRPVGIMEMPDGSLLFTDDTNHRVYRISYDRSRLQTP